MVSGFFAYPSDPTNSGDAIRAAVEEINKIGVVKLQTWENLRISGRILIEPILTAINEAELFCVDLTN